MVGVIFPLGTLGSIYFAMQQETNHWWWFGVTFLIVNMAMYINIRSYFRLRYFLKLQDNRF